MDFVLLNVALFAVAWLVGHALGAAGIGAGLYDWVEHVLRYPRRARQRAFLRRHGGSF